MSPDQAKQAALMLSENHEWLTHSCMFKLSATVFCTILSPGIINTATGGKLLAQAFPDMNGLERFGLAGIGLFAAWFFLKLALASHTKALADKDAELIRLQNIVSEKEKRIGELENRILKM